MKTAYLTILTWTDSLIVMMALHYYGRIRFGEKDSVDVEFILTKDDATKMNMDRDVYIYGRYKTGESSTAFTDEKKLIKEAIKLFKKDPHGYDVLLKGDHYICDPQKVICGPKDIMLKANRLWNKFESYNGWGCKEEDESRVRVICDKWDDIIGKVWERS